MLADRIRMCGNKKIEYVIPTDSDFEFVEDSNAPNTYGGVKGYYHYIGTDEYVIVPDTVQGNSLLDCYKMFDKDGTVKGIISNNPNVTDMNYMFGYCNSLTSIDLTPLDTTNVTNMSDMFYSCSGLTSIDLTPLDTTNVTDMNNMFQGCSNLTSIDLTPLDTTNVTNMNYMFYSCSGLTSIDLTPLDTTNVTNMNYMFGGCSGLTSIDLTPLDTTNVTDMNNMFYGCSGLWYLYVNVETDVDTFKTSTNLPGYVTVITGNEEVKGIKGEPPFYLNFGWTETLNDEGKVTNLKSSTEAIPIDCTLRIVFYNKGLGGRGLISSVCINDTCSDIKRKEGSLLKFNANDTLSFEFSSDQQMTQNGYIIIYVYNYEETPAYKHDIFIDQECYLTTCMVGYYGKDDDGVELTAMRKLREKFKYKHADTLIEYKRVSPYIIQGIEQSGNRDYWYSEIKKIVDNIVIWVANEEWEKAETAYLSLYYKLKHLFYREVRK